MGVTGNFSWESSDRSPLDYWVPLDSYKSGGALSVLAAFDTGKKVSLSDDFRFYSGYYSDEYGSGLELGLSNVLNYSNRDFNGYLKLSGTMKEGDLDYWSFTIELGTDAGLPDLLSLLGVF